MMGSLTGYNIGIEDDPSYLLRISLPKCDLTGNLIRRSNDAEYKKIPTLFSKYADYLFINDTNPLKMLNGLHLLMIMYLLIQRVQQKYAILLIKIRLTAVFKRL